jgi:hypothetical protein
MQYLPAFSSATCNWPTLSWLGQQGATVLLKSHELLDIPANLANPLPVLEKYFCLQERVGLAFSAVSLGAAVSVTCLALIAKHSLIVLVGSAVPAGLYLLGRGFI